MNTYRKVYIMNINLNLSGLINIVTIIMIIVMVYLCSGCNSVRYNQAIAQDKARLAQLEQEKIDLFCAYNQCDNIVTGKK